MSVDHRPPSIDPVAAARWLQLPRSGSAWLHEEVARRMLERLDCIRVQPRHWVHWEPTLGGLQAHAVLQQRYRAADGWVVERGQLHGASWVGRSPLPWWSPARWRRPPEPVLPASGVDMLWANMGLHMAADPLGLMRQWHQSLAPDGFLMFSCLGPDTLHQLRTLYQVQGWPAPTHDFTDMHDWGDLLLQAGFAEPVLDMERVELTFATPARALQELRELGRNLQPQRFPGLRGRGWYAALQSALAQHLVEPGAQDGALRLTFELVYGHAVRPATRGATEGQVAFSLGEMRETLRQRSRSIRKSD